MHENKIELTEEQVLKLISEQAPQYASLPLRALQTAGTVNYIYRLGEFLTVRFPMERQDSQLACKQMRVEAEAMEEFAKVSLFQSPRPVFIGEPSHTYPMPWLIQTWVPGEVVTPHSVAQSESFAEDLVRLISSLRKADPKGRTFRGTNRGGDLIAHDAWMNECFTRSKGLVDTVTMRRMWQELRTLPRVDADRMSHTDLIPFNLLTHNERLIGVLDTGNYQAADPALDLVAAWHMLEQGPRDLLRSKLGCSDLQWERGKAWALQQASGLVWYYKDSNPEMADLGRTTLRRLIADYSG